MTTTSDTPPELPSLSSAGLAKATGMALLIAFVLLVFVVLPAEYDIDPTGIGGALGLTRLSTVAVEGEAPRESAVMNTRNDRVVVEVPAARGVEYKFFLRAGQKMKYSWESPSGSIYYDFHGEPDGNTTGFFESYAESTSSAAKGTFTAPFDGAHGWYWKNASVRVVEVTLETSGSYEVLGVR